MEVKLLKDSRVFVKAGETINVSPAVAKMLFSMKAAEAVKEEKPAEVAEAPAEAEPEPEAEPEAPAEVEPEPVKKPGRKKKG